MPHDASEILMESLAGLGIFFFGMKMITRNLSAMAGDQLRRRLNAASHRTSIATLFGAVAGFVSQSGRTTSFIMASFVQAGMIEVRRALPIVLWANFGCTLVIFTAIFPIHLFALFLLAAAGVCIAFERPKPLLSVASATFGLALMLFGLQMMSSAATVLTSFHAFATALSFIRTSLAVAFLMGLILTFIAQSHIAIVLIAITMASRRIFDFDQTLMVIFGAHAGASLITYVTGIHFRGQPRQVVTAQILYNLAGLALFIPLFVVDHLVFGRGAQIERLANALSTQPGAAATLVTVLFNTVTPLALTAALPAFHRLCERLAPPLGEEDLGRPQFLRDEVIDNTMATLLLIEKEQLRLLQRLPAYFAWIRGAPAARGGPTPETYHEAFLSVSKHIERFHNALVSQRMNLEDIELMLNQQKRLEGLEALDDTFHTLCTLSDTMGADARELRDTIVESLDAMLLTAIAGVENNDANELEFLSVMTRDRGPGMERMRKSYLEASDHLSPAERNLILQFTSLFERGVWSLHRYGALLADSAGGAAMSGAARAAAGTADPALA